jgi:FAD:protein FMN transferase
MIPIIPLATPPLLIADSLEVEPNRAIAAQSRLWRFHDEYVLGTRLEVLISTHSRVFANEAASAVRKEIERLNLVFNHRRSDSELTLLNRSRIANTSVDLFAVVQLGEVWRQIMRGAFDGRMGALLRLWAANIAPNRLSIEQALAALGESTITLDRTEKRIELSETTVLSLDAIAKGYIVDAALNAARRAVPEIMGLAIAIGGDIRCWGESPDRRGWRIGIPDATNPAENAPLVDAVWVKNAAIATSGRGPRDCIGNEYRSTTISPFTGRPVRDVISATVVATHAADADAIATACMVLHPEESIGLVNRLEGAAARITDARSQVHQSSTWPTIQLVVMSSQKRAPEKTPPKESDKDKRNTSASDKLPALPPELRWPVDWELGVSYIAPERQDERSAEFRTPFMALWITDEQNRPVRTLYMIGKDAKWQRDNFIWWGSQRERAEALVELRSQATSWSGRYQVYWGGDDDDSRPLPIGKYIVHVETSQERGKHSHRSVTVELGSKRFKTQLPKLPDSGGIEITYGHYNDRFNSND